MRILKLYIIQNLIVCVTDTLIFLVYIKDEDISLYLFFINFPLNPPPTYLSFNQQRRPHSFHSIKMKFTLAATALTLATAVSALAPNCVEEYVGKYFIFDNLILLKISNDFCLQPKKVITVTLSQLAIRFLSNLCIDGTLVMTLLVIVQLS